MKIVLAKQLPFFILSGNYSVVVTFQVQGNVSVVSASAIPNLLPRDGYVKSPSLKYFTP